ncbi:MAG: hypothetical protein LC713_07820, partial [Actinobacteria bacterium]|nr:hypothetical protein [Actinomycetota bacterium]
MRAVDRAGNVDPSAAAGLNVSAARRSFTVRRDLLPPVFGRTFNAEPLAGKVFVSLPPGTSRTARAVPGIKGRRFIPLASARQLPLGSLLDTRRGEVRLTSARNRRGATQFGEFRSGVFEVVQSRRPSARGLTGLRLKGSSFRGCDARLGRRADARISAVRSQGARRRSRQVIRKLRGSARGRFRTVGRYSSATVRGTAWQTVDRCDGTLTSVKRGRVVARDRRGGRSITLSAGQSHLTRPTRASRRSPAESATCPSRRSREDGAIIGSDRRDDITGTNGADVILASGGNDQISGGGGNDCLEGGRGADQLDGSNGADRLLGGPDADDLSGGIGDDRLQG